MKDSIRTGGGWGLRLWLGLLLAASQPIGDLQRLLAAEPQQAPVGGAPAQPGALPGLVQFQGAGPFDGPDPDNAAIFATDRATLQRLAKARELLAENRYSDAVRLLGAIVESPQDYFFQPDKQIPLHRSLKSEAQRLIGQLPRAGREAYELQFGAEAQRLLDAAVERGDAAALSEISRRFFHTRAGQVATYLIGIEQFDRGRPLGAALCFERLRDSQAEGGPFEPQLSLTLAACWLRAGQADKARRTLQHLATPGGSLKFQIAGRELALGGDPQTWLSQLEDALGPSAAGARAPADRWPLFRGDSARNAPSSGGLPLLNPRWKVPTTTDPLVTRTVEQLRKQYQDLNRRFLPSMHPLVVDQVVLMRTTENLLAVDWRTGKRIWEVPADETLARSVAMQGGGRWIDQSLGVRGLTERLWADQTFGTLSSDGELVFSVEDLAISGGAPGIRTVVRADGRQQPVSPWPKPYNRLTAHEIRTGKLRWEVGGPEGDEALEHPGAFFLGPPLPLGGKAYALAETGGEIRLIALDARSGASEWSQQLAVVEDTILQDETRRLAGVSPSYADGVLVCPTAAGALVAVDLTTRSLLWGYRYGDGSGEANRPPRPPGVIIGGFRVHDPSEQGQLDQWLDSSATLAGGRVLITPVESDELHCLDLLEGTVLWRSPREDGLYLAGVQGDLVLVVGRQQIRGLRLTDGAAAWSGGPVRLGADLVPSGRGFAAGDHYYLPLSNGEIAAIDVPQGKIDSRTRSRTGSVPGNLVSFRGGVLSQGLDAVESFFQRDELARQISAKLEAEAIDPQALALHGELLLDQGSLGEAVAALRESFRLRPDPRTRRFLVEALLTGLEQDFAAYRATAAELEGLLEKPQQQAEFLRRMALGLEAQGEVLPAFEVLLKFIDPRFDAVDLERVDPTLEVRRDRWVRGQLEALREAADDPARTAIDRVVERHFQEAVASRQAEPLARFLRFFGEHPLAASARQQLVARLDPAHSALEMEMHLRRLEASGDRDQRAWAVATLAALLRRVARPGDAAVYYRLLAGELADAVCLDGKTGRQLVAELPDDSPVRGRFDLAAQWPAGRVEKQRPASARPSPQLLGLTRLGSSEPFFDDVSIELDQGRPGQPVIARDGLGRELWRVPLVESSPQAIGLEVGQGFSHVVCQGHLLVVSLGRKLFAIDTLSSPAAGSARVIWSQDTLESVPGMPANQVLPTQPLPFDWGGERYAAADAYGRPIGQVGPLTFEALCYQRSRELVAADPRSGQTLWRRTALAAGSDCFGDDELLFVVAPGSRDALVLRTLDGRQVGTRRVPPLEQRMATSGRRVLAWAPNGANVDVKLVDAWTGRELWSHTVPRGSKADVRNATTVAVADPGGRFWLWRLEDGAPLVESPIEAEPGLKEIFLLTSPDRYLLVTHRPWAQDRPIYPRAIPSGVDCRFVNGHAHGFSRQDGAKIWSRPVERQALLLRQPAELPVLVFVCHIYERSAPGRSQNSNLFTVLCLDKRNGRILHQEQSALPLSNFELQGDPQRRLVELNLTRETVRMTFTDEPEAAGEEPAAEEAAGDAGPTKPPTDGEATQAVPEEDPFTAPPSPPGEGLQR